MVSMAVADDGGEWQTTSAAKRSIAKPSKRLYIGNLPCGIPKRDVAVVLTVDEHQIDQVISTKHSSRAFVSGLSVSVAQNLIAQLDQTNFQGRTIRVQWEQQKAKNRNKQQTGGKNQKNQNQNAFGNSRSWSKPSSLSRQQQQQQHEPEQPPPTSLQEASERIESIIRENEVEGTGGGGEMRLIDSLLATTAAVSLVASGGFNVVSEGEEFTQQQTDATPVGAPPLAASFQTQSLSSLLQDYGEYDDSWKKESSSSSSAPIQQETLKAQPQSQSWSQWENRLGQHGKAPLHVEFTSFGFHHGVPSSVRGRGWSHAQPLPVFDARDTATNPIPPHLKWQDGVSSGLIKKILLQTPAPPPPPSDSDETGSNVMTLKQVTVDMAAQTSQALVNAVAEGGYGYAQPLVMVVYVGSELGRHRSVVAAEMAATALRQRLRKNEGGQFAVPVSVGTRHVDIAKALPQQQATKQSNDRNNNDDDDDDAAAAW